MYITMFKIDGQRKFDARSKAPKASALGQSRGIGWGGKRLGVQNEGHMYAHCQFMLMHGKNHRNIVK